MAVVVPVSFFGLDGVGDMVSVVILSWVWVYVVGTVADFIVEPCLGVEVVVSCAGVGVVVVVCCVVFVLWSARSG